MWEKALLSGTDILYPEGFFQLGANTDSKNKTSAWLVPRFHTGSKQHFFRSSFSSCIGLFQKKKKTRGLRTWNFQGYWRKSMWKFQELIKKEVEFLGVYKKENWCGISMGLGIWPWNIQGVSHNFAEFPGMKACFLQNF